MKALNIGKALIVATLTIFSMGYAQAQVNDPCTGAIALTCGQTVTGSNTAATNDAVPTCGLSAPRKGVWYTITGTGGLITLTTCSATSNFDTQIAVYTGACTALTCVIANDNDPTCTNYFNRLSRVSFTSTFGTVYRIMVSGKLGSAGTFTLATTCAVVAPPNDACANSILTTCGSTVTGSTVGSTIDAVGTCGTALNTAGGVWYRFVGTAGSTTVSLCGSGYDTKVGIFTGSCGALTCVTGNDDFCSLQSQVTFTATAGTTYYVLVTGFSTAVGNFTMNITCATPPPPSDNNPCSGATPIACGGTASGTTATATLDGPAASCTGGSVAADRWYSIVGTGFSMTATTCTGTSYDSKLDIYTGACGALTSVACNDDACGLQSTVTWPTTAGTTYLIRVHGFSSATGAYTLGVTCATSLVQQDQLPQINDIHQFSGELNIGNFFPNPAVNGNTSISIETPVAGLAKLNVVDNLGRAVRTMEQELYAGANMIELNLDKLAVGTYFVSVEVGAKVMHRKLVVTRP